MEEYNPKYFLYLLQSPGESTRAEYKAAIKFEEDTEFSIKLVKHMLGFANSNGGYVVIGFNDRDFKMDPKLSAEIVASYDTTRLGQYVKSHISNDESVMLSVHKIDFAGHIFPIINVQPFKIYPYFTSDKATRLKFEGILKKGSLYYRDESARTLEIANVIQFKIIIDRCVRNRQAEILSEFRGLLETATGKTISENALFVRDSSEDWINDARKRSFTK